MRKYGVWALAALWLVVIFAFSSQPADSSNELSGEVTRTVAAAVDKVAGHQKLRADGGLNHLVRKNAHFFNYMLLGVLVMFAFGYWKAAGPVKRAGWALLGCALYASTDEVHQLFVDGRGAQVKDVFIDSSGACLGIALFVCLELLIRRRRRQRLN
ncbi:VanZ family protein [Paenibacillus protaetiae]|uniref:VanZ family protein n=1 Tax=Paenibacillus protaetiae TaxID=2509456 RepID=A0A4P6F101_9BACL|nr:VanZ family protein [Paenibacillus protaetiae]QAY67789.1 VanZ family protein [Paenibacillus protaetiae]